MQAMKSENEEGLGLLSVCVCIFAFVHVHGGQKKPQVSCCPSGPFTFFLRGTNPVLQNSSESGVP